MNITIELNDDQTEDIVRNKLIDDLNWVENAILRDAIEMVIAYYSVPGSYKNGKYDMV